MAVRTSTTGCAGWARRGTTVAALFSLGLLGGAAPLAAASTTIASWQLGEPAGATVMRDSSGNVGRIKVLPPALPERNAAVRTSPPESRAVTEPATL